MIYQVDAAYGTLMYRMRGRAKTKNKEQENPLKDECVTVDSPARPPLGEAESIMASERGRLEMPHGIPTFESIEKERRARSGLGSILEK